MLFARTGQAPHKPPFGRVKLYFDSDGVPMVMGSDGVPAPMAAPGGPETLLAMGIIRLQNTSDPVIHKILHSSTGVTPTAVRNDVGDFQLNLNETGVTASDAVFVQMWYRDGFDGYPLPLMYVVFGRSTPSTNIPFFLVEDNLGGSSLLADKNNKDIYYRVTIIKDGLL